MVVTALKTEKAAGTGRSPFLLWASVLSAVTATALSWRFRPLPMGPHGIDAGWQWIVNVAADHGWSWGRELVFTYGPLGWLINPQDVGSHLLIAGIFSALLQIMLLLGLLRRLFRAVDSRASLSPASVFFFSLLWYLGAAAGRRPEGSIVLIMLFLCLDFLDAGHRSSAVAAGLLLSVTLLIKASLGVSCMLLALAGVFILARRKRWQLIGILAASCAAGLAVLLPLLFDSSRAFFQWISRSLEIIRGYSTAASILGPKSALLSCFGLMFLFLCFLAFQAHRREDFRTMAVLLPIPLLIFFRLAFVRQDGHQFLYLPLLISCLAFPALWRRGKPGPALVGAALFCLLTASTAGATPFRPREIPAALTRNPLPGSWNWLLNPGESRKELREKSRRNLRALHIDPRWSRRIRESGKSVAVIPWEALYAPASGLEFTPLRCTQLYSAYTAELDRWTAAGFETSAAPGWVLDDFAPVGKRRALLDAPATWRTIWENYALEDLDRERGILLLKRRPRPLSGTWRSLGNILVTPGKDGVRPPDSLYPVFAEIHAPLNFLGVLNAKFFRVPMLLAVFHREDGTRSWTRLIAATAVNGILVSDFPRDFEAYAALWTDKRDLPVRSMEIIGPGLPYYARTFRLQWKARKTILPQRDPCID